MPTTTVRNVIQSELLKVCKEVTTRLREKHEKKNKKVRYKQKEIARMRELLNRIGWDASKTNDQMEIFSILHDAPELIEAELPLELFCVFVCEQNVNLHRYTANVPYILTHVAEKRGLDLDGTVNAVFKMNDKPRYATDEEIDFCIRNLNEKQMNFIHRNDTCFKPIMEAAMNRKVGIEEPAVCAVEDGEEVKLPDGRTITMACETNGAPDPD